MVDATDAAFVRAHPDVAELLEPAVRRRMIEPTFRRILKAFGDALPVEHDAEVHVAFGALAARAGVPLQVLLAGYRLGATVGWAHVRRAVEDLAPDPAFVLALADIQVSYLDQLVANSIEGFDREAEQVRGERVRERQSLLDQLITGAATEAAAHRAGWPWPERVAVAVVLDARAGPYEPRVLLGSDAGTLVAVAEPSDLDRWLARTGVTAAVGTTTPVGQAATSLAQARRVAALHSVGVTPDAPVLRWDELLTTLVVHSDPVAAAALVERRLGPLSDPSANRERMLLDTLGAWLATPGQPLAMARAMHVHTQTARYRLDRLRDRLGDALDDPDARFEFALALRCRPTLARGER